MHSSSLRSRTESLKWYLVLALTTLSSTGCVSSHSVRVENHMTGAVQAGLIVQATGWNWCFPLPDDRYWFQLQRDQSWETMSHQVDNICNGLSYSDSRHRFYDDIRVYVKANGDWYFGIINDTPSTIRLLDGPRISYKSDAGEHDIDMAPLSESQVRDEMGLEKKDATEPRWQGDTTFQGQCHPPECHFASSVRNGGTWLSARCSLHKYVRSIEDGCSFVSQVGTCPSQTYLTESKPEATGGQSMPRYSGLLKIALGGFVEPQYIPSGPLLTTRPFSQANF